MGNEQIRQVKIGDFIKNNCEVKLTAVLKKYPQLVDYCPNSEKELHPLGYSAWYGYIKMADVLLKFGANIDLQLSNGETALMIACKRNWHDFVKFLLEKNANTSLMNCEGETCLDIAILNCNYSSAYNLVKSGVPLKSIENYKLLQSEHPKSISGKLSFDISLFVDCLKKEIEPSKCPKFINTKLQHTKTNKSVSGTVRTVSGLSRNKSEILGLSSSSLSVRPVTAVNLNLKLDNTKSTDLCSTKSTELRRKEVEFDECFNPIKHLKRNQVNKLVFRSDSICSIEDIKMKEVNQFRSKSSVKHTGFEFGSKLLKEPSETLILKKNKI